MTNNKIYYLLKRNNFVTMLGLKIVVTFLIYMSIVNISKNQSFFLRLATGIPIIIDLFLTFIIYKNNKENNFAKIIFILYQLFFVICCLVTVYELYFYNHNYDEYDLLVFLFKVQRYIQLLLFFLIIIFSIKSKINKKTLIVPIIFTVLQILTKELYYYDRFTIGIVLSVFLPLFIILFSVYYFVVYHHDFKLKNILLIIPLLLIILLKDIFPTLLFWGIIIVFNPVLIYILNTIVKREIFVEK